MFKKVLIASAILVSAIGANAASSAPFSITGTATPGACNVTLGGAIDFGAMSLAQVKAFVVVGGPTYLAPSKNTTITVVCSSATKAELSFQDNKPSAKFVIDANDAVRYGLTDGSGTAAIGSYHINISNVLLDTVAAAGMVIAPTGTTTWTQVGPNGNNPTYPGSGYSVGFLKAAANTAPDTFTNLTANLNSQLFLSKSYIDAATNVVTFNGSSVITMQYL